MTPAPQPDTGGPESGLWITTSEAAQRLGVKRATLYAYVSRGVLRSQRRPGQQESLYDRDQVDALATVGAPQRESNGPGEPPRPPLVMRHRGVSTAVSSHRHGGLAYRGVPLERVLDELTLEQAVDLIWTDLRPPVADQAVAPGGIQLDPWWDPARRLPLDRRVPFWVMAFAATTDCESSSPRHLLDALVDALLETGPAAPDDVAHLRARRPHAGLAARLHLALAGRVGSPAAVRALSTQLVALLDHGLTPSTVAARVAASTRASWADCLLAAYATMAGPLHGGAPALAHDLLRHAVARSPRAAVEEGLVGGRLPGFGHVLYQGADPRTALVLADLWRVRGTARLRRAVQECVDLAAARHGSRPNVDLALGAVLVALDLPRDAGHVLFQVARTVGVVAHIQEEWAESPLRWRGASAEWP